MKFKFPIFLSIRNKATRLPDKSFVDIGGLPAIEQLVVRLKRSRSADGVVICTSTHPDDARFEPIAQRLGVGCFRGSEDDKLDRYLNAARAADAEFVVVVDGDDILCDPAQIDRILAAYQESGQRGEQLDYVIVDRLPVGGTGFGVRVAALARVVELKAESDTEVWGGYFTDTGLFKIMRLAPDDPRLVRPDVRFTLDYPEDLQIFRIVFEHWNGQEFGLADAVEAYDAHPNLRELASTANQRYLPHLSESASVKLKT